MPGSMFSLTLGRMEASMYKWALVWGGGKYSLYRLFQFGVKGMHARGSISLWGGRKQACINGTSLGWRK